MSAVSQAPTSEGATSLSEIDRELEHLVVARSGRMVGVLALMIFIGSTVILLQWFLGGLRLGSGAAFGFIVLAAVLGGLLQRQRIQAAVTVFLWGSLGMATFAAIDLGGMNTPALLAFPVVTTAMGLMLSRRQAILILIGSIVSLGVIAWTQDAGMLPPVVLRSPFALLTVYVLVCSVGSILGISTMNTLREQYRQSVQLGHDLAQFNASLEEEVARRTVQLTTALERLKHTQNELIESEKLASLGSMVAGIAHELNTPLGNALMVATTLQERARAIDVSMQAGGMKKSELSSGLGAVAEMSILIEKSVHRASALVTSFKQVAIDQVSERRRRFDLREVVDENLQALRPGIKNQPWVMENEVPPGIICDSFPGPLGQMLINLIQNSMLHGFAERDHGTVRIGAEEREGILRLTVSDDGIGMDTATTMRIFEPFFTTKLGHGGSGLGLSICYRIVTTIFSGEIRVVSTIGAGTQIIVTMPQHTPGKI